MIYHYPWKWRPSGLTQSDSGAKIAIFASLHGLWGIISMLQNCSLYHLRLCNINANSNWRIFFLLKREWIKQLLLSSIFVVFILSGSLFVKENNLTAMFVNPLAFLCSGGIFIVEYLLAILNCSSIYLTNCIWETRSLEKKIQFLWVWILSSIKRKDLFFRILRNSFYIGKIWDVSSYFPNIFSEIYTNIHFTYFFFSFSENSVHSSCPYCKQFT